MTAPVCEVVDLVKHFGPVHAVDGVSLEVGPGEVVALVGESGSGKSTVGRLIVRLLDPTSGQVLLDGADMSALSRRALRPHRRTVSIVFQDPRRSLDPRMTRRRHRRPSRCGCTACRGPSAATRSGPCSSRSGCAPAWPSATRTSSPAASGSG